MLALSLAIRRTPLSSRQPGRTVSDEAVKQWLQAEAQIKADFYARMRAEAEIQAQIEAEVQRRLQEKVRQNNPVADLAEDLTELAFFYRRSAPSARDYPRSPDWSEFISPSSSLSDSSDKEDD